MKKLLPIFLSCTFLLQPLFAFAKTIPADVAPASSFIPAETVPTYFFLHHDQDIPLGILAIRPVAETEGGLVFAWDYAPIVGSPTSDSIGVNSSPLDSFNTNTGITGNPVATSTTATANDVIVTTLSRYSTTGASSNRTSLYNDATGSVLGAASYQSATSTGPYSNTYTGTAAQDWSAIMASFKPASGGSSTTTGKGVRYLSPVPYVGGCFLLRMWYALHH